MFFFRNGDVSFQMFIFITMETLHHVRRVHIHFSSATFSTKSILLLQDSQVETYGTLEDQGCYFSADI